jgi:hypothetical protein
MNGRFQMHGGKNDESDECKPVLLGLLAENLEKPLISLYGTELERGSGH